LAETLVKTAETVDRVSISTENILTIDPLADSRWENLVKNHPRASVFHTTAWLRVLRDTYGYKPTAYGLASPTGELRSAILLCEIKSWITGKRLVSLPFSDHCEPLVDTADEFQKLIGPASLQLQKGQWRYLELRPLSKEFSEGVPHQFQRHMIHMLDLTPPIETLYKNLHVDSIRRKIQKADKLGFKVEAGSSELLLREFYGLHILTRRRQSLPPHPLKWFRNILKLLDKNATIRVARKDHTPVSAVLTLEKDSKLVYKYGCSDAKFHSQGAMPFVFWNMISDAKSRGIQELDFGRSELDNAGLIAFKDKWGAARHELVYTRDPLTQGKFSSEKAQAGAAKFVFSRCPDWMLIAAGNFLYPHVG
jgi:lipid II:glycine glycyltransferase (peptidoglycan interpeptide bridge formation enzyme)